MATTFEIKVYNIDKAKSELRQQAVKALEECGLIAEGYANLNDTLKMMHCSTVKQKMERIHFMVGHFLSERMPMQQIMCTIL